MNGPYVNVPGTLREVKLDKPGRVFASLEGGEDREILLGLREEVRELRGLLMQVVGRLSAEARER